MRRPLHIAVLDEELPYPLTSGKRIRTFNLLTRLARRHRITYLCHRNADPAEAQEAADALARAGITPAPVDWAVPPKSGPRFYARLAANLFSPLSYSVATHSSRALREAARRLAETDPPDLWHCEWTPYAQTLRRPPETNRPPAPWLVMAHNVESLIWQRYAETESHPLKRWYVRRQWRKFERFERWAYSSATRAVAVSPEDAALMRERFGGRNVDVVDNGVDTAAFTPGTPAQRDPFRVLFLGSLDWRPNLDAVKLLLEDVFPRVRAAEPRAKLVLVGRQPPEWLRQQAGRAGVELHADVADVRPFLAGSGLLAVPLRIGGGSRLKILEALATGLPVVTTRVGVEGLSLEPGRHVAVVESPSDMPGAILRGLHHPRAAQLTALEGRKRVLDRYDWGMLADRLEQVWLSCVDEAGPAPLRAA